jgi:transcriptional/translational regulatory protein YebC/TACO1
VTVPIHDEAVATQVLRLCDALEEDDDVQNVYANFDLPEELLSKLSV